MSRLRRLRGSLNDPAPGEVTQGDALLEATPEASQAATLPALNDFEANATAATPRAFRPERGPLRSLVDSVVALAIAVILFRTFAAEGYLISTGSMAPALYGFHQSVVCPNCQQRFAVGTSYDPSVAAGELRTSTVTCPNCSQEEIDIRRVPINHGDQLLVFKLAYALRPPRRWEVAVFRNPSDNSEAYVKRVVGLPGEQLQIIDGNIHINGRIATKDWVAQRQMRILVHDQSHRPKDRDRFRGGWAPADTDRHMTSAPISPWHESAAGFVLDPVPATGPTMAWLDFSRWVRSPGRVTSSVQFAAAEFDADVPPQLTLSNTLLDRDQGILRVSGPLPESTRDQLLRLSASSQFREAVESLYARSHHAPITDVLGYNTTAGGTRPLAVREVQWAGRVRLGQEPGQFVVALTDGLNTVQLVLDTALKEARLTLDTTPRAVATLALPAMLFERPTEVEFSIFDHHVYAAIDGQDLFGPIPLRHPTPVALSLDGVPVGANPPGPHVPQLANLNVPPNAALQGADGTSVPPVPLVPVRLGGQGVSAEVSELRVYRDVYYTSPRARRAVQRPFSIDEDEYFVLGDNSAVSHDSRRWDKGTVPANLFVGKPFVVHLPSQPARLRIGNYELPLRWPDWDRIRWLP